MGVPVARGPGFGVQLIGNRTPPSCRTSMAQWTYDEVAKHNSRDDCYVILYNKVYDLTEFIPEHPGGPQIIIKYAGKDAT